MRLRGQFEAWPRVFGLVAVLVCLTGLALAPAAPARTAFPTARVIDGNGADLVSGSPVISTADVTIGQPDNGGLSFGRTLNVSGSVGVAPNPMSRNTLAGGISSPDGGNYTVVLGASTDNFRLSGGVYTSLQGMGSSLTFNSTTGVCTYTDHNGVVATFSTATLANVDFPNTTLIASVTSVTSPAGEVDTHSYETVNLCASGGGSCSNYSRLQSMTNNFGYQLKLTYSLNSPTNSSQAAAWQTLNQRHRDQQRYQLLQPGR